MNKFTRISMLTLLLVIANSANASKYDEINPRQHVDNESMNKVAAARLQGMLAGKNAGQDPVAGDRDCSTKIGNQNASQSLIGSEQNVIVIGDVINVCQ